MTTSLHLVRPKKNAILSFNLLGVFFLAQGMCGPCNHALIPPSRRCEQFIHSMCSNQALEVDLPGARVRRSYVSDVRYLLMSGHEVCMCA